MMAEKSVNSEENGKINDPDSTSDQPSIAAAVISENMDMVLYFGKIFTDTYIKYPNKKKYADRKIRPPFPNISITVLCA